jgi:NitT/TauT family transport system substrate-binding protein
MKTSCLIVFLAAVGIAGLFARGGADATHADGEYAFRVGFGVTANLCAAPFYIAIDKGYFDEEGLTWERVNVGDGEAMNLLTSGQIDGIYNLLATLVQPLANGLDVQVPLALHTGCVKILVPKNSSLRTPADLKGKTIGTASVASSPTIIARRYLANIGLKVDGERPDVSFIYQSAAELPLLLQKGGIVDAIGLNDPAAQIAENAYGYRVLVNSATDGYLKDEFCCVVPVRRATIAAHPVESAKFIRAIQKASKYVQENPDETARILVERNFVPNGDVKVYAGILKTYSYRASVSQARVALDRNVRDLQKLGLVKADVDAAALVANTYIALPGVPDTLY